MSRKRDYHKPLGVSFDKTLEVIAERSKPKKKAKKKNK